MPEPKRPLKVFLCHAHADRDAVRGLYTRLTQDGVDAWLDKAKLLPGQDWELEIHRDISNDERFTFGCIILYHLGFLGWEMLI